MKKTVDRSTGSIIPTWYLLWNTVSYLLLLMENQQSVKFSSWFSLFTTWMVLLAILFTYKSLYYLLLSSCFGIPCSCHHIVYFLFWGKSPQKIWFQCFFSGFCPHPDPMLIKGMPFFVDFVPILSPTTNPNVDKSTFLNFFLSPSLCSIFYF